MVSLLRAPWARHHGLARFTKEQRGRDEVFAEAFIHHERGRYSGEAPASCGGSNNLNILAPRAAASGRVIPGR